ncbi:ATP-binding cassette sub-family B member 10, mitochondrial [Tritrichomonas foetus]|uniref:ATP-binding cassette sub-family B member 10, mitochondrial n=1 Tax=Tritrichomonas foetus TaxID=1144522 RepID=A0A1J4JMR2_9EUKA|nr:ATP-binding cassette sub-family B member 10, mitochondrial [Tritrichomonas foetus]|eukprot:OHS98837.1 ATP-binding cassette sub-family B member 10, mitochondrial [Tritrichomonas foetus]
MTEEPLIEEILLDEFRPKYPKKAEKKKHRIFPFLPRMYWLFYRHPINFLIFIPSLTEGWVNMATTICMGNILDAVNKENAMDIVKINAFYAFLASILCGFLAFFNHYYWFIIGDKIGIKIKRMLFKSLMEKDMEFFDTHTIGDLLNYFYDDVSRVGAVFREFKTTQVSAFGKLLAALFVMYSVNFKLATFALITAIGVTIIVNVFKKFAFRHFRKSFDLSSQAITIADETLSNQRIVSSFNRQIKQVELFKDIQTAACDHDASARVYMHSSFSLGNLIDNGAVSVILNIGAFYAIKGFLTPGQLFSLSKAAFWTGMEIHHLLDTISFEFRAIDSSKRIFEVIDTPVEIVELNDAIAPSNFVGKVEFKNVWFKYPTRNTWVLKNISFVVEPSEITAIVGHSGSGKSTIVQLLLRFYDVDQGVILLDGVDIKKYNFSFLRKAIGVVQQDPHLFSVNIKENIAYGQPDATDSEIYVAAGIANAAKFIDKLPDKYETMIGEKGTLLSGGQKQRIAIARAVLTNPKLLITDEATSALDAESERKVQQALDKVMDGRTSIIIAHRLGTIRAAKSIYVFDQGQMMEHGTHEELLQKQGVYYNLVQRQLTK